MRITSSTTSAECCKRLTLRACGAGRDPLARRLNEICLRDNTARRSLYSGPQQYSARNIRLHPIVDSSRCPDVCALRLPGSSVVYPCTGRRFTRCSSLAPSAAFQPVATSNSVVMYAKPATAREARAVCGSRHGWLAQQHFAVGPLMRTGPAQSTTNFARLVC